MRPIRYSLSGHFYDFALAPAEWAFAQQFRRATLQDVAGRVLEIGVGTGLNLTLYDAADSVVALDFDRLMLRRAPARAAQAKVHTRLILADAQELPFAQDSFDTVVSTLVFCTVPDPIRGMEEVKRVLRSGGRFLLVEHVRSPSPMLARLQDRLNPAWRRCSGGCNLNRETLRTVQAAGFAVERVTFEFWKHVLVIDARAPGHQPPGNPTTAAP